MASQTRAQALVSPLLPHWIGGTLSSLAYEGFQLLASSRNILSLPRHPSQLRPILRASIRDLELTPKQELGIRHTMARMEGWRVSD